ncbi:CIC11C00000000133 [Sungouiella intermedia]|uniref:CIC11C00000000133 n=1 Tax=Sungouiella intermedia TaxID=45354 RepID=A0A1L0BMH4_9ASCO|nr:CIC11C00000000133 [[Candida] intermedia]
MTEEQDSASVEELPPFSFLKKPIKNIYATSVISSILNKTSPDKKPPAKATFNNIDYDEQIRAPRMSGVNHYTYEPESPRPFTDRKNLTLGLSRSTSHELVLMLAQKNDTNGDDETAATSTEQTSQYLPATADLNQSTRRNLEPVKPRSGMIINAVLTYASNRYFELDEGKVVGGRVYGDTEICDLSTGNETRVNGNGNGNGNGQATHGVGANNENNMKRSDGSDTSMNRSYVGAMKGSDVLSKLDTGSDCLDNTVLLDRLDRLDRLEHTKLMRAMHNLNSNTMTTERTEVKDEVGGRVRSPTMGAKGPGVQQVYNLKKPLCTPAVLRPTNDEDEMDMDHSLELEVLTPMVQIDKYPFQLPDSYDQYTQQEPTHNHWMPNNLLDHCMKCFEVFGNFFTPQRKRRHHCRFCGMLFCQDCLHKSKEMHYFQVTTPEESTTGQNGTSDSQTTTSTRRAYSGSSNASHASSTTSTIKSGLLDDAVGGVMMDSKARFVVPLFPNLVGGAGVLMLHPRFKQCKTCKTCGANYQRLVNAINQRLRASEESEAPYVFIENPYTSTTYVGTLVHSSVNRADKNPQEERRASLVNNVPSDWTWSSF